MRIGVVSDTHGHLPNTLAAIRVLEPFEISQVLHCGDIGSPDIAALFSGWPAHFVFGNVDQQEDLLRRSIEEAGGTCHGRFGSLELAGMRVALLHGDDNRRLQQAMHCGEWDLVCYGHTHKADHRRVGNTWLLNPGAVFRARPHSVAVVDLPTLELTTLTF